MEELEKRVSAIERRNDKFEADKAWEGSYSRKLMISFFTYSVVGLYLYFIIGIDPWLNAIVPTAGFLLSTLTFSWFKNLWVRYIYKN